MSVCLSSTAEHKSGYSYPASVILSAWMWINLYDSQVIVNLIYQDDTDSDNVNDIKSALDTIGAHVLVTPTELNTSCVLMGQLARILAYNYKKVNSTKKDKYKYDGVIKVNANDIIMTADTDLFPVGYDFLKPLGMHIKLRLE